MNSIEIGKDTSPVTTKMVNVANVFIGGRSNRYIKGTIFCPLIENRAWDEAEIREDMYHSPMYHMLRGLPYSVYIGPY